MTEYLERVQFLRAIKVKYDQETVARLAGVSVSAVSKWYLGEGRVPATDTYKRMRAVMEV